MIIQNQTILHTGGKKWGRS